MGMRFRKSIGFGPLRFTLTPKGISKSLGVGPFRITKRADGKVQTTTRIPGTGLSYTSTGKRSRAVTPVVSPVVSPLQQLHTAPPWAVIAVAVVTVLVIIGVFILAVFSGR